MKVRVISTNIHHSLSLSKHAQPSSYSLYFVLSFTPDLTFSDTIEFTLIFFINNVFPSMDKKNEWDKEIFKGTLNNVQYASR